MTQQTGNPREQLVKEYGLFRAVDKVDFEVHKGDSSRE